MVKKQRLREGQEAIAYAADLIQMYQAGYRDAYRKLKLGRLNLTELNKNCSEAFTMRFKGKLNRKINKNGSNIRQKAKKAN